MSDARYAHEQPLAAQSTLTRAAMAHRGEHRPTNDRELAAAKRRREQTRVFVRGRYTPRGLRWDVLRLQGGRAELWASGIEWQDEAIEAAAACLTGRVRFGATRGATSLYTPHGSLILPDRRVSSLAAGRALLTPRDGKKSAESMDMEVTMRKDVKT